MSTATEPPQAHQPLVVFARLLAKRGREDAMRAALLRMIEPTRAEEGCLFYDLHQSDEQPGVFFFHESWTGRDALKRHMGTPHMQEMDRAMQDLQVEPYSVMITTMISTPAGA